MTALRMPGIGVAMEGATIAGVAVSESEQTMQTSNDPFTEQKPISRKALDETTLITHLT